MKCLQLPADYSRSSFIACIGHVNDVRNVNVLAKQITLIKQKESLPIIGTMCYLQFLPTHFEVHLTNFYDSN